MLSAVRASNQCRAVYSAKRETARWHKVKQGAFLAGLWKSLKPGRQRYALQQCARSMFDSWSFLRSDSRSSFTEVQLLTRTDLEWVADGCFHTLHS